MKRKIWLTCLAMAAMLPLVAFGHAKLLGTSPASGEQLEDAPKRLTLKFNEAVQLGALKLSTDGRDIPLTIDANAAGTAQVTVALPALAPGTYRVQWSALTVDDGHVVKGTFSFVVAGAH